MGPNKYRNSNILFVAIVGICVVVFSVMAAAFSSVRQRNSSVITLNPTTTQSYQQAASSVLSCQEYDTLFGTNYNQLLYSSYAVLSQMTNRVPGQNQSFLNFQYNAAADQAYGLYTSTLNTKNCTPSIAAPTALTPAAPPSSTNDPSTLIGGGTIPAACAYPLALQYLASYYQQYVVNMQNEQTNLVNFINNLQPTPTSITLKLQQGAGSVQAQFYNNVKNLTQLFSTDVGSIGC